MTPLTGGPSADGLLAEDAPTVGSLTVDVPPARPAGPPRWLRPEVAVAGAALAVFGWGVGRPSPWRDEAATFAACRRSSADLLRTAAHADAVHLAYYLLTRTVLAVHDSVTAVRLVSVVLMAAAAAVLTAIGRRTASTELGVSAGAVFVVLPLVSRWAQDARPVALFTLLGSVATWLLVEALRSPAGRAWWAGYAGALVAVGAVNVLALLVVPAHLAYLLLTQPVRRVHPWAVAVAAAGVPLLPWLGFTFTQRGQVAWIDSPHLYDLTALYIHAFGSRLVPPVVVLGAVATLVLSRGLPGGAAGQAFVLGACWAGVPPLLLWTVSLRLPLWDAHYLLFATPGLALLAAAEIATVTTAVRRRRRRIARERHRLRPSAARPGRPAADPGSAPGGARGGAIRDRRLPDAVNGLIAAVAVPVLALIGAPAQLAYRDAATGHDEDTRGVATYLQANARPGDAVLFVPAALRDIRGLYPERFAGLQDVALDRTPAASGTLRGVEAPPAALAGRLAGHARVWLVTREAGHSTSAADAVKLATLERGHHADLQVTVPAFRIVRYERNVPAW